MPELVPAEPGTPDTPEPYVRMSCQNCDWRIGGFLTDCLRRAEAHRAETGHKTDSAAVV